MDGLLLQQFRLYAHAVSPIKQLHSHPSIHPSARGTTALSSLCPSLLLFSFSLFPPSPPLLSLRSEDSSPRSGFRAIKKRACCSRYSRRVRDRSCVISLPLPPRIESLQAGKRGIFISIFRRFLLLFSSLINFSLRSFLFLSSFLSFDKSSIDKHYSNGNYHLRNPLRKMSLIEEDRKRERNTKQV